MYTITRTPRYIKRLEKFLKKHNNLADRYKKTVTILAHDPAHPSLRLHKLKGVLQEFYSVSINMEYRIIIDFVIVEETIILIDIGSHDEVY
ncbi:MAG: type II toxin-antitoxin system mRNA interferase toxin, RelE/StbE family [Campylobacterales bacterium]|nr:type II toxin-antitoxin system mRNA interferase toxin, RelE/StbE family [Campylobacterales bacterium]